MKAQSIASIDRKIDRIHATMRRLENIDRMSAESWQAAWDKHPDLHAQETELYRQRGELQARQSELEVHEHSFVSGGRSDKIKHSHYGGSQPHTHPHTGPSYYGHRTPKVTTKPTGEQLETIPRPDEENSFDLVITDSARHFNEKGEHVLIGDMPIENIRMFAADVMKGAFRLKCNVRDERTR